MGVRGGWPRETLTREQVSEKRCWWTFLFDKRASTLAQAGLELAAIPLPQPPECWAYSLGCSGGDTASLLKPGTSRPFPEC